MPTPTIIVPFGESSGEGDVFAVVALDPVSNVDIYGNELNEFIDSELVNILVHTEVGAKIIGVSTSYGTIINSDNPKVVTRSHEIDEVVFKGTDSDYTLPYYPSSGVSVTWIGYERNLTIVGRKLRCRNGAGICNVFYKYQAYQYILEAKNLNLGIGEDFPVEISFDIERNNADTSYT